MLEWCINGFITGLFSPFDLSIRNSLLKNFPETWDIFSMTPSCNMISISWLTKVDWSAFIFWLWQTLTCNGSTYFVSLHNFQKFLSLLISSNTLENVMICLSTSHLVKSLVKTTLLLQNVYSPDLVESILETCWKKVPDERLTKWVLPGRSRWCSSAIRTWSSRKNDTLPTSGFLWWTALAKGLGLSFIHQFEQLFWFWRVLTDSIT